MSGNKMLRLDDFSVELFSHTANIQRMSALCNLKQISGRRKKCLQTVVENWDKKQVQSSNLKSKFGKLQRAPQTMLRLIMRVSMDPSEQVEGISRNWPISKVISSKLVGVFRCFFFLCPP